MVKNQPAYAGDIRDVGLIPGLERSPGGGHGNPFHCSCLENPVDRGACRLQPMGSLRVRQDSVTSLSRIGEGNGNPFHCSCLENPGGGGA